MYTIYDKNFELVGVEQTLADVKIKLGLPEGYFMQASRKVPGFYSIAKKYYAINNQNYTAVAYFNLMRLEWALLNPRFGYMAAKYINQALEDFKEHEL